MRKNFDKRAWRLIIRANKAITSLEDLLAPYMDPDDVYKMERDMDKLIQKLVSWVEKVEKSVNEKRGR